MPAFEKLCVGNDGAICCEYVYLLFVELTNCTDYGGGGADDMHM